MITTERLLWHCGAHTAEPKLGPMGPIPPIFRINQSLLFSVVRGTRVADRHRANRAIADYREPPFAHASRITFTFGVSTCLVTRLPLCTRDSGARAIRMRKTCAIFACKSKPVFGQSFN